MVRKVGVALGVLIAVSLVLALVQPLLARPIPEQKLREIGIIEPDCEFVEVNGLRTRYVAKGQGDALLLIHGFSSSLYTWRASLDALAQQYRVYALDLKGFGFSDKPDSDYTIDEYVDFVAEFMNKLDMDSAVLCGNSMGGNISWRLALKYPDRVSKLILVDASGYPSDHTGVPFFVRLGRLPGAGNFFGLLTTRSRIRDSLESAYFDDRKVAERTVDSYFYPMKTKGAMHAVLSRLRSSSQETANWHESISSIKQPTLIVWGAEDTWVPVDNAHKFHKDIAGAQLVLFPDCGHLPQEELPEEFAERVLQFLGTAEMDFVTDEAPSIKGEVFTDAPLTVQRTQCYHKII